MPITAIRSCRLSDDRGPKDAQDPPHDREAVGAQGVPLTPGRSIAVDNALHVYGTPFFIQADLPLTDERHRINFDRLMIAQDTGSAIVGPARADIFWGAGDRAGQLAGHVHHPAPRECLVWLVQEMLVFLAEVASAPLL